MEGKQKASKASKVVEMGLLEILIADGLDPKKGGGKNGGEYGCACPACGSGKSGTRFRVWPEQGETGRYWCRICQVSGDGIDYLKTFRKLTYVQACEALGIEPRKNDGWHDRRPWRDRRSTRPLLQPWAPRVYDQPGSAWAREASAFLTWSIEQLHGGRHGKIMDWLMRERLLDEETIRTFYLGFNPEDQYRERPAWGLEPEQDDKGRAKRIWLPRGVVLPCYHKRALQRLRIRRGVAGEKIETGNKYIFIPGGTAMPFIAFTGAAHTVIVESELDAILINQEAGDLVNAAAMGSVAMRPDNVLDGLLRHSRTVLLALDVSDDAGAKTTWQWWSLHYPQAARCYIPCGKDPTDAAKNGVNIRDWIEAGLKGGALIMQPKEACGL